MVFNKFHIRQVILVLMAIVIIGLILIVKFSRKDMDISMEPVPAAAINDLSGVTKSEGTNLKEVESPKPPVFDNNDETLKALVEQMKQEREQKRRIKNLKMQREETDLELQEQKALSELDRLKKDSIDSVDEGNSAESSNINVKIVYLGGTDSQKEAILSINGTNYFVKDKDRPFKNIEVLSITNDDVTIHFSTPVDITNTYQFKSE